MQNTDLNLEIIEALHNHDYQKAETISIEAIKKNRLNAQLWLYLTQALTLQGYGNTARKAMERAWLLDPQAVWVEQAIRDIEKHDKGLEKNNIDELLTVKNITVSAAIIVKNEEDHIGACLSSLVDAVDEIIVVDTGSDDRTIEIAESFEKVKIYKFEWCDDFSAARNAAFPHITSDWVFWIDADECLFKEDIPNIRIAAALFDNFSKPVLLRCGIINEYDSNYSITNYDTVKLFPMKYGLRYSSKIHEQIIITDEKLLENGATLSNAVKIRLNHIGYKQSVINGKQKLERNIKLLREMVDDEKDNPIWLFFLGRELYVTRKLDESIACLNKCIELINGGFQFGRTLDVYTYLIKAYLETGKLEEAETKCIDAMKIRSYFPDIQYLYGKIEFTKASYYYKIAEEYVIKSKQEFETYRDVILPDSTILDWKADLLYADIRQNTGRISDAKTSYEKALVRSPKTAKDYISKQLNYIEEERIELNRLAVKNKVLKLRCLYG